MFSAFQSNAFQSNAFQIAGLSRIDSHDGGPSRGRSHPDHDRKRREELEEVARDLREAIKSLEQPEQFQEVEVQEVVERAKFFVPEYTPIDLDPVLNRLELLKTLLIRIEEERDLEVEIIIMMLA